MKYNNLQLLMKIIVILRNIFKLFSNPSVIWKREYYT